MAKKGRPRKYVEEDERDIEIMVKSLLVKAKEASIRLREKNKND